MFLFNLVSLPEPTDFLASTTEWSSPIFTDLLPFVYLAAGLAVGIGLVALIIHWFGGLFHKQ